MASSKETRNGNFEPEINFEEMRAESSKANTESESEASYNCNFTSYGDPPSSHSEGDTVKMECDSYSELIAEKALDFKNKGNDAFKNKEYSKAIEFYTNAIANDPCNAAFYSNRSAAYFSNKDYSSALEDGNKVAKLDPEFLKGYFRIGKCHLVNGDFEQAKVKFERSLGSECLNSFSLGEINTCKRLIDFTQQMDKAYDKQEFRGVIYYCDQIIQNGAVNFPQICAKRAEAQCLSGKLTDANISCNDALRMFKNNSDLIYVKALVEYYQDNLDKSKQLFEMVLKSDPDHRRALKTFKTLKKLHRKKEEGNQAVKEKSFDVAKHCYNEALTIDPFNRLCNAKLYCNLALCKEKLGDFTGAIMDCTSAIDLDERYIRAYQRRAKYFQDNNQHDEAVVDYETLNRIEPSQDSKAKLREAKRLQKIAKRKDYYKILDIPRIASDDEIKRAYRKKAIRHHPDKHVNETAEKREDQERLFKEAGEAYAVLSDSNKRARYDRGEDLDEMGSCDIDPTQIFQTFFGGGGRGAQFQSSSGFPGGFTFSY